MKVFAFMASEPRQLRAQHGDLPLSFLKLAAVFLHAAILVGLILSLLFFNLICESVCLEPVIIYASMSEILGSSSNASYLYPINTNVSNFVNVALDSINYTIWEDQILSLLDSHGFRSFINGKVGMPPRLIYVSMTLLWFKKLTILNTFSGRNFAKILKRWITSTLSKEITCFAVGSKSAFDLWNILKEKLAKASKGREFHLHGELQSNKRDTASS